jgi:hypothetical protein
MLKFEAELADNFKKIYAIGSEIKSLLNEQDKMDELVADKILELYKSRQPHFARISQLIAGDSEGEGKIKANLEKWREQLRPLIAQDRELQTLLGEALSHTKSKLMDNAKGKGLALYSKGG